MSPETELDESAARVGARSAGTTSWLWSAILAAYLLATVGLGYVAFLSEDTNPALDPQNHAALAQATDPTTKQFLLTTLREEDTEHDHKTELARQSFHVVLGALLGFLSASAAQRLHLRPAKAE